MSNQRIDYDFAFLDNHPRRALLLAKGFPINVKDARGAIRDCEIVVSVFQQTWTVVLRNATSILLRKTYDFEPSAIMLNEFMTKYQETLHLPPCGTCGGQLVDKSASYAGKPICDACATRVVSRVSAEECVTCHTPGALLVWQCHRRTDTNSAICIRCWKARPETCEVCCRAGSRSPSRSRRRSRSRSRTSKRSRVSKE